MSVELETILLLHADKQRYSKNRAPFHISDIGTVPFVWRYLQSCGGTLQFFVPNSTLTPNRFDADGKPVEQTSHEDDILFGFKHTKTNLFITPHFDVPEGSIRTILTWQVRTNFNSETRPLSVHDTFGQAAWSAARETPNSTSVTGWSSCTKPERKTRIPTLITLCALLGPNCGNRTYSEIGSVLDRPDWTIAPTLYAGRDLIYAHVTYDVPKGGFVRFLKQHSLVVPHGCRPDGGWSTDIDDSKTSNVHVVAFWCETRWVFDGDHVPFENAAASGDREVMRLAASHEKCPQHVLIELAGCEFDEVRWAVRQNTVTPARVRVLASV